MSTYFKQESRVWTEIHPGVFASELHRYGTGGGAALFRLDAGAQMPEHNHPSGEHGYVIEGTGVFGDQTLSAGDAFWMAIDERHAIRAITRLVFIAMSLPKNSWSELRIERITELPEDFGNLVVLSLREDFGAMQRTREDWDSRANRFDRPGEILFGARDGSRLVGICGLNQDPYAQSSEIGRVRHLYVDPAFRRRGIGRLLVSKVVEHAGLSFARVRLRTLRADADQFYVALGFRRVVGEAEVTHELEALSSTKSA